MKGCAQGVQVEEKGVEKKRKRRKRKREKRDEFGGVLHAGKVCLVRCRSKCSEVGAVKMGTELAGWCRERRKEKEGREDERRNRGREGGAAVGRCRGSVVGCCNDWVECRDECSGKGA